MQLGCTNLSNELVKRHLPALLIWCAQQGRWMGRKANWCVGMDQVVKGMLGLKEPAEHVKILTGGEWCSETPGCHNTGVGWNAGNERPLLSASLILMKLCPGTLIRERSPQSKRDCTCQQHYAAKHHGDAAISPSRSKPAN